MIRAQIHHIDAQNTWADGACPWTPTERLGPLTMVSKIRGEKTEAKSQCVLYATCLTASGKCVWAETRTNKLVNKTENETSNWMWISTFWGSQTPPCTNKAIICIICHSSSFPNRLFFLMALSFSSDLFFFFISVAAAVIRRGTLMKQSYFPPTVKEPHNQLLHSSAAKVTPPSSVLWCLFSQMTWFVF